MIKTAILMAASTAVSDQIPDKWTKALAMVESGDNCNAQGDGRTAIGPHQFHRSAWGDVTKIRKAHGLPTWNYRKARTREASYAYAHTWLTHLRDQLRQILGREPTLQQIFLAHNMGLTGFGNIGYDPHRAPRERADAADRFANLAK